MEAKGHVGAQIFGKLAKYEMCVRFKVRVKVRVRVMVKVRVSRLI